MNGWMDGRTGKTILSAASGNFQVEKYKSLAVGNRELIPPPPNGANTTTPNAAGCQYLPPATASTVDSVRPH